MRSLLLILLGVCLFSFSACRREASIDIPKVDPMPVMYGFLSPEDSEINISISMSNPINGSTSSDQFQPVTDATVSITDNNGKTANIPLDVLKRVYILSQADYPIEPGKSYTVKADFGKYHIQAGCQVPVNVPEFDSVSAIDMGYTSWGQKQYSIFMKWTDFPGQENFYRVSLEEYYANPPFDTSGIGMGDKMFSDKYKDGSVFTDRFDYFPYNGGQTPSIFIYLIHCDYHYYEYHRRRLNYFGDDPFSEPYPQYTNVKNGFGVVGAYRKSRAKVPIL